MIRWDEPIEAVHELGRVSKVSYLGPDAEYHLVRFDGAKWYARANGCVAGSGWQIRNVTTPTPPNTPAGYSDEVVERISRVLRAYARNDPSLILTGNSIAAELYALADLLPEPVDPDLAIAEQIADEALDITSACLAAIRRGRELERQNG